MVGSLAVAAVVLTALTILFFRGNKLIRLREEAVRKIGSGDNEAIETLAYVSYHGGLPEIPKPQKLTIALADSYLLLLTNKGEAGKSPFARWRKVEQFTTLRKHDPRQRSMVLWGPFNNVIFKDQKRHFIVINYLDRDGRDNRLLIETGDVKKMKEIFGKLNAKCQEKN